MPNRFDKFVHEENVRLLKMQMEAERDPGRQRILQALLKEEEARNPDRPTPGEGVRDSPRSRS